MASTYIYLVAELGFFLGVLSLLLAATLVHETGHAVAGLICGFRIMGIRVGPVEFRWEKKWVRKSGKSSLTGGFVLAHFREVPGPSGIWRCFALCISGPLANLLAALVLLPFSFGPTVIGTVGGYLFVAFVFDGFVNLIPFKTKFGWSDGAKLCWLIFSKKRRHKMLFLYSLMARVEELNKLSKAGQLAEALQKTNALIATAQNILNSESLIEWMQKLLTFRDAIQTQLEETEKPSTVAATT